MVFVRQSIEQIWTILALPPSLSRERVNARTQRHSHVGTPMLVSRYVLRLHYPYNANVRSLYLPCCLLGINKSILQWIWLRSWFEISFSFPYFPPRPLILYHSVSLSLAHSYKCKSVRAHSHTHTHTATHFKHQLIFLCPTVDGCASCVLISITAWNFWTFIFQPKCHYHKFLRKIRMPQIKRCRARKKCVRWSTVCLFIKKGWLRTYVNVKS